MPKFIKVTGVQCNEDGSFLHSNPTSVQFLINITIIKAIFPGGDICIEPAILHCYNTETHFRNIRLVDPKDLNYFIIDK